LGLLLKLKYNLKNTQFYCKKAKFNFLTLDFSFYILDDVVIRLIVCKSICFNIFKNGISFNNTNKHPCSPYKLAQSNGKLTFDI